MNVSNCSAYELIEESKISDLNSIGYLLRHKKSGARVAVLENDDENKVFNIGFRTPPKDSTGVAHIVEHTVLCGSDKFPVKDPFIELAKGSLNTFLNAMTYPDKTVYPVASCNDKDFQNLMHVYLDAVFYPNIYKEEKIFRQEGWHYELESVDGELIYNGVVFNEMKGVFSSAKQLLDRNIQQSLFPDTAYGVESGGDPASIPDLTYEDYLAFHKKYYHPSNSYLYLYGNMDMEEKLNWIDENYLSHFEKIEVDSEVRLQKPFAERKEEYGFYSVTEGLIEEARKAAQGAYAPFSGYRVGAAARLASGRIITAANQESEVFPAGLCAERVLLFSHLATDPEDRITALAIASVPDDTECCPCGGCRQVMLDTMRRQGTPFRIIMSSGQSATVVDSPACLMPFPFGL